MRYIKLGAKGEVLIEKVFNQDDLTSDCWTVQFEGIQVCDKCPHQNTARCGGGETLKRLKKEAK